MNDYVLEMQKRGELEELVDARVKEAISQLQIEIHTSIVGRYAKALEVNLYLGKIKLSSDYIYVEDLLNE